jgi:hypothetical protein
MSNGGGVAFLRWDGDIRGRGVGEAGAFANGAEELVEAMRSADWVAEEPEVHLLPHLRAAVEPLPLELRETRVLDDGTFEVELTWTGNEAGTGEVRRSVYVLVGSVAETATYVRQRRGDDGLTFELVTGSIGDDARFAPHGHAVRLRVRMA